MTSAANPASWLTGPLADLPTPFDAAGALDLSAFANLCERQVAAGAPAIVVSETAGEASTLSALEQSMIIRTAVEVARGRVRVIAGVTSNATSKAIALAKQAEAAGADAILSVVPYYNKPIQAGIEAHFLAIADSTEHSPRRSREDQSRLRRRNAYAVGAVASVHWAQGRHRRRVARGTAAAVSACKLPSNVGRRRLRTRLHRERR